QTRERRGTGVDGRWSRRALVSTGTGADGQHWSRRALAPAGGQTTRGRVGRRPTGTGVDGRWPPAGGQATRGRVGRRPTGRARRRAGRERTGPERTSPPSGRALDRTRPRERTGPWGQGPVAVTSSSSCSSCA